MSKERKWLMIGVFFVLIKILACIFVTDWFFLEEDDEELMTETLVGILIGTPLGMVGAFVAFYTDGDKDKGG